MGGYAGILGVKYMAEGDLHLSIGKERKDYLKEHKELNMSDIVRKIIDVARGSDNAISINVREMVFNGVPNGNNAGREIVPTENTVHLSAANGKSAKGPR